MENKTDQQNQYALIKRRRGYVRFGIIAAGIGVGSVVTYLLGKVLAGRVPQPAKRVVPEHIVDDRGTNQERAARILLALRDRAFEADNEKLAVALGRPVEEIAAWNAGVEVIDDDVVMKARGIALHRGVNVE
jgi:hypothetical protein